MDEDAIRAVVVRLARPHPSGGKVIERAALLAMGSESSQILEWITAHGAVPEDAPVTSGRGLFGGRLDNSTPSRRMPGRYLLPPGALG